MPAETDAIERADRKRVPAINIVVAIILFLGAGSFALLQVHPGLVVLAFVAAICWGIGMGANEMIWITLTKRQFGTAMFAYSYGAWSFSLQAGYALGGPLGGWAYDQTAPMTFPIIIVMLYLPAVVLAVWRPGLRN